MKGLRRWFAIGRILRVLGRIAETFDKYAPLLEYFDKDDHEGAADWALSRGDLGELYAALPDGSEVKSKVRQAVVKLMVDADKVVPEELILQVKEVFD